MLHPDVFPGAVPTSHPLVSSPDGNNHYRSFVGHVYELYSAGGSLECRNVLSVGHEEIKRIIEDEGVDNGPVGSCHRDCKISERVNADFERADGTYWSFGGGIPGLPGIQSINRACTGFGACGKLYGVRRLAFFFSFPGPRLSRAWLGKLWCCKRNSNERAVFFWFCACRLRRQERLRLHSRLLC